MESFNKILSFILGLIAVVIILAFISRRLSLGSKFSLLSLTDKPKVTPTKTVEKKGGLLGMFSSKTTPTPTKTQIKTSPATTTKGAVIKTKEEDDEQERDVDSIPATGSPTLLIPILVSIGGLGALLKRISNS